MKASPQNLRPLARSLGPLVGLAAAWAFFALLAGPHFRSLDNQRLMLLQTTVIGAAAIGATLIIASGGIDLSVGSSIALASMVVALLLNAGAPPVLSALGGVATSLLCGGAIGAMVVGHVGRVASLSLGAALAWWAVPHWGWAGGLGAGAMTAALVLAINELTIKRLPLPPFIVTLGMLGALRGIAKGIDYVYPPNLGWLPSLMSTTETGIGSILPPSVWILLLLALAMAAFLRYTVLGRYVLAIGSNEAAARYCGVKIERVKLWVYILGVGCAGVAGVLQFGYLSMGDPATATGYELKAIAAVVIGGASLSGGIASVRGTIIGALIMTVVDNGCTKLGLDNWVQEIVTGGIIVAAVAIDRLRHRQAE
jgi:ribose/xylose/arabinose/galactoside ABC-type transport system permease subunit